MSTFTDFNGPQTGMSAGAMTKFANEYAETRAELSRHKNELATDESKDVHGIRSYVESKVQATVQKTNKNESAIVQLFKTIAGLDKSSGLPAKPAELETYFNAKLDNKDLITFIQGLVERIAALEAELNTLSLIQFDNVPVGAGIRWYRDTLPEDGTYVWANGQTLYGVNQNFPELARVWELGSADNVKVPQEDHTIFKVRKADRKIQAIQHAYIEPASGDNTVDFTNRLESITSALTALQQAVETLSGEINP